MGKFTDAERIAANISMFGCQTEDLDADLDKAVAVKMHGNRTQTLTMLAMSLLSDSQEEIARGLDEQARKTINCAKYFILKQGA